jgi:hypothetical protein
VDSIGAQSITPPAIFGSVAKVLSLKFRVPEPERGEVMAFIASLEPQIVER